MLHKMDVGIILIIVFSSLLICSCVFICCYRVRYIVLGHYQYCGSNSIDIPVTVSDPPSTIIHPPSPTSRLDNYIYPPQSPSSKSTISLSQIKLKSASPFKYTAIISQ